MHRFQQIVGFVLTLFSLVGAISIVDDAETWFRVMGSMPRGLWFGVYVLSLVVGLALLFGVEPQKLVRRKTATPPRPSSTRSAAPTLSYKSPVTSSSGALDVSRLRELHQDGMKLQDTVSTTAISSIGDGGLRAWENSVINALGSSPAAVTEFLIDAPDPAGAVFVMIHPRQRLNDRLANLQRIIARTQWGRFR